MKIFSDESVAVELSRVKFIKKNYADKTLIFEFNNRIEFVHDPRTDEIIQVSVVEAPVVTESYETSDTMHVYFDEWVERWDNYLKK